jgi:integrase
VYGVPRRDKGLGGLVQRHDHTSCPPPNPETGRRPEHRCRGRWQGSLSVEPGSKQKKYVYGRTQKIAQDKLIVAIKERDSGTLVVGNETVSSWLTTWLERKARPPKPLKPQTLRGYRSKVDRYIVPSLGRHRLTDLRAHHIDAMYDAMRGQGLAEATLRQTHAILGKALSDARRKGLMRTEPLKNADAPGTEKNKRAALSLTQAQAVLEAAGDEARWWLGLFCGMRQGEVLGLRWEDIDQRTGVLTIAQTLQTDVDGTLIFGAPKSDAGTRSWPMPPKVQARVRLHWIASGEPATGLVFARPDGSPQRPRDDWQAWRDLLGLAGQPPVALHAARQSSASLMEAAKVPDRLAAQILGHSTVQMTHGYQSADHDRIREAWASMDRLLELN